MITITKQCFILIGMVILVANAMGADTGAVTGLCARGGFEVDMTWKDGQLTTAVIRSKHGQACRVTYGGKTWESNTKVGTSYRLDDQLKPIKENIQ